MYYVMEHYHGERTNCSAKEPKVRGVFCERYHVSLVGTSTQQYLLSGFVE